MQVEFDQSAKKCILMHSGKWQDVMILTFEAPEEGLDSYCNGGYEQTYLIEHLDEIDTPFSRAVSAKLPISWDVLRCKGAPAFLFDIAPADWRWKRPLNRACGCIVLIVK